MTPKYVRSAPKINLITSMRGRCFSSTYFYVRFSLCSSYLRVYVRNIVRSVCPTYVNYYRSYWGSTTHTSTVRRVRHSLFSPFPPFTKGEKRRHKKFRCGEHERTAPSCCCYSHQQSSNGLKFLLPFFPSLWECEHASSYTVTWPWHYRWFHLFFFILFFYFLHYFLVFFL